MGQVLHDGHIGKTTTKTLSTSGITLFADAVRRRGQDASKDLVQGVDDASLQQNQRHFGTDPSRSRQSSKEKREGARRNERRAACGKEEHVDSADEVDVNECLEILRGRAVIGINDADDAETSKLDKALV